jgi:hypothetical protein
MGEERKVLKLFIGYKTKACGTAEKFMPEFKAPSNYKDAAKISTYVDEKKAAFLAESHGMPYTGTLDEVVIFDPNVRDEKSPEIPKVKSLLYKWCPPEEERPPVSVRVRNYLLKTYPNAWSNDTHNRKPPSVIIIGFDPRTFLKIMGLECSLPYINKPCPLGLWYSNTDHRDIGEAVCPREFSSLTLPFVVRQRRPTDEQEAKIWDALTKDWKGPGYNAEQDAKISVELASQLGFLD